MKQPDSDTFLFSEKIVQLLQMQHTWNKKHHIIPFYRVQINNTMFIAYHCCIAQNELTHIGCLVFLLPQSLPNGQSQATCVSFSLAHPQLGKLWRAIKSKFLIVGTHVEVEWMCAQNRFFSWQSRVVFIPQNGEESASCLRDDLFWHRHLTHWRPVSCFHTRRRLVASVWSRSVGQMVASGPQVNLAQNKIILILWFSGKTSLSLRSKKWAWISI